MVDRPFSKRIAELLLAGVALIALAGDTSAQMCTGDCDDTGIVAVNELITGVNILLGSAAVSTCRQFDRDNTSSVEIDEVVAGVGNALFGCQSTLGGTSKSGPIAISPNGRTVVAVNTDANTVSVFAVAENGQVHKRKELGVGREPRSVAILPSGRSAYVANTVSGTVSVISLVNCETEATVEVGTEPWAVASSPNGRYVYVANANSNSVSVIDTRTNEIFVTIPVGRSPRALAVTNDGDDDDFDEKLYVPNFYARPRTGFSAPRSDNLGGSGGPGTAFPPGANGQNVVGEGIFDDSREGVIDVISTEAYALIGQVVLGPVATTGFNIARGAFVNSAPGDWPRTIFADGGSDGTQPQATGAFPNLLQSIVLFDGRGFVPSSAASPEPPLRFNGNVQSLVSVYDLGGDGEITDQTFNLNRGINFDVPPGLSEAQIRDNTERMFPSAPVDVACSSATNSCWVVSQGSDFIVRMSFDGNNRPTINAPTAAGPFPVSPVTRIYTIDPQDPLRSGRNPRGIVLSPDGTRGYVVCPTTRDVIVMDLEANSVVQRVRSSELPLLGTAEETVRRGKIDFFTSRPPWSDRGWGGCWSCHPDGRTDNVTWSFEAGPRQTVSLDGTFNHRDPEDQRVLNWSPVRDENQDFELNTRGIFGGRGFITVSTDLNGDGITPDSDPNVRNFGPASSGRAQQQEDITAFLQFGIRAPIAPPRTTGDPERGIDIFSAPAPEGANCIACHSGGKWTTSRVTYDPGDVNPLPGIDTGIVNIPPEDLDNDGAIDPSEQKGVSVYLNGFNSMAGAGRVCEVPPPPPGVDVGGTMASERIRIVRQTGLFAAANPIEVRSNGLSPVNTVAPALAVNPAFGAEGFNTPSLLGVFDTAPYFHNGAVRTLEQAFGIGTPSALLPMVRTHWRAGTGGAANILENDGSAATDLIAFLRTIDERLAPFPAADLAPDDAVFGDAAARCDCQKDPPAGMPAIDCLP